MQTKANNRGSTSIYNSIAFNVAIRMCISPHQLTNALHKLFLIRAFSRRPIISDKKYICYSFRSQSLFILYDIIPHNFTICNYFVKSIIFLLSTKYTAPESTVKIAVTHNKPFETSDKSGNLLNNSVSVVSTM